MVAEVDPIRGVEVPTRIVHGEGAIARLGELVAELDIGRPLVVSDCEGIYRAAFARG
jgi:alcohol dehydrogenase class IV